MTTRNPNNEKAKYQYRILLAKADGKDKKTWMSVMQHILNFEKFINFDDFTQLNESVISSYIDNMTARDMSLSYMDHNIKALRRFYEWLVFQKGYKKIDYNLCRFFQLTDNQRKTARASEYKESYELDDIRKTIANMPNKTMSDQRNRAIISLQALCGLRISELRTVKMKNLIFDKQAKRYMIYINPKDMSVKFAKTRCAFFMPFDNDWVQNVLRWSDKLKDMGWTDKDPLFPIIPTHFNQLNLLDEHIQKIGIRGNNTIIKVFKQAFTSAGFDYIRPHSFRHTIARWAETQTPEVFNAVRQSLGHFDIKTSFDSYGNFSPLKIGRVLNNV